MTPINDDMALVLVCASAFIGCFTGAMAGCCAYFQTMRSSIAREVLKTYTHAFDLDAGRPAGKEPMPGQSQ